MMLNKGEVKLDQNPDFLRTLGSLPLRPAADVMRGRRQSLLPGAAAEEPEERVSPGPVPAGFKEECAQLSQWA